MKAEQAGMPYLLTGILVLYFNVRLISYTSLKMMDVDVSGEEQALIYSV